MHQNRIRMKILLFVFMTHFNLIVSKQYDENDPHLLLNMFDEGIYVAKLDKQKFDYNIKDAELIFNTDKDYVLGIDYNIRANILIWSKMWPDYNFYVAPIDKR
jgi:hypothetical protein